MKFPLTRGHLRIFREQLWRRLRRRSAPCPLCDSRQSSLVFKSPNVHMAVFRSFFSEKVVRCGECDFVYTTPRLPPEHLATYYTKYYSLEGLPVPRSAGEFLGDTHKDLWLSKERDLQLVLSTKTSGRLLDVGCASGSLLWLARQRGFRAKGVEIARAPAEFARKVLDFEVFCGQIQDAHFADREFDVVTLIHSLEHMSEPRPVLREINRILADDGALIIIVPNLGSWSAQRAGPSWKWLQPQNHYSHFTPETLLEITRREGFKGTITSEEGRYGEEEIRSVYGPGDMRDAFENLKGSEIVFLGQKGNSPHKDSVGNDGQL